MCSGLLIIAVVCLWACFCASRGFILSHGVHCSTQLWFWRRTTPLSVLPTFSLRQTQAWLAAFPAGAHCWQMFDLFIRTPWPRLQSCFLYIHGLFLSQVQDIVLGSSSSVCPRIFPPHESDLLFEVSRGWSFFCVIERRSLASECGNRSSQCFACQE